MMTVFPFPSHAFFAVTHREVGHDAGGAADPVDGVEPVWSSGQRQVSLVQVFALPQGHVAHQQQPRAVGRLATRVLQTGSGKGRGS